MGHEASPHHFLLSGESRLCPCLLLSGRAEVCAHVDALNPLPLAFMFSFIGALLVASCTSIAHVRGTVAGHLLYSTPCSVRTHKAVRDLGVLVLCR